MDLQNTRARINQRVDRILVDVGSTDLTQAKQRLVETIRLIESLRDDKTAISNTYNSGIRKLNEQKKRLVNRIDYISTTRI